MYLPQYTLCLQHRTAIGAEINIGRLVTAAIWAGGLKRSAAVGTEGHRFSIRLATSRADQSGLYLPVVITHSLEHRDPFQEWFNQQIKLSFLQIEWIHQSHNFYGDLQVSFLNPGRREVGRD